MPLMQEIKNGLVFVRTSPFLYWIFILVSSRLKESSIPWPKRLTVHPAELFASRRNRSIHQIHDDVEGEHEYDNH